MTTIKCKHGRTTTGGISLVALLIILTLSTTKIVEASYLYPEKNGNDILCLFSDTKPDVPADQDEDAYLFTTLCDCCFKHKCSFIDITKECGVSTTDIATTTTVKTITTNAGNHNTNKIVTNPECDLQPNFFSTKPDTGCKEYIYCEKNVIVSTVSCPDGQLFNGMFCDIAKEVTCDVDPKTMPPPDEVVTNPECDMQPNFFSFKPGTGCKEYIYCEQNVIVSTNSCPDGQLFNGMFCDIAKDVVCVEPKTIPTTYVYTQTFGTETYCLFSDTEPDVPADRDEATLLFPTLCDCCSKHMCFIDMIAECGRTSPIDTTSVTTTSPGKSTATASPSQSLTTNTASPSTRSTSSHKTSTPSASPAAAGKWYAEQGTWSISGCKNTIPYPIYATVFFDDQLACCKGAYDGQTSGACIKGIPNPPTFSPTTSTPTTTNVTNTYLPNSDDTTNASNPSPNETVKNPECDSEPDFVSMKSGTGCKEYIYCEQNVIVLTVSCPDGLLFNGMYCDFSENVVCVDPETVTSTTSPGKSTALTPIETASPSQSLTTNTASPSTRSTSSHTTSTPSVGPAAAGKWYAEQGTWSIGGCKNTIPYPIYATVFFDNQLACCKGAFDGQMSGACIGRTATLREGNNLRGR